MPWLRLSEKKTATGKKQPVAMETEIQGGSPQQTMRSSSTGVHKHHAFASYASFLPGNERLKNQAFALYKIDERSNHWHSIIDLERCQSLETEI